jgi:glycolate oxidase iron-sulfur subunit
MEVNKTDKYKQLHKFETDLNKCMKCGFCTYFCPVYQEEKIETSVARGKNMMIRELLSGNLDYTNKFHELLNKCTLCMACTGSCPAKANIPNIIVAARADYAENRGVGFIYRIVYKWLLPHRRLFGDVVRFISWFQGIFLPKTEGTISHLSLILSALGKGRNVPRIAPKFLRDIVPILNSPSPEKRTKMRVGYFMGCMTDFVMPELGERIINFLTNHGVEVVVPKEQGCCGAPVFLSTGDFDTGRKMADTNVKAFEGLDYIISDCASCTSALKDYSKFLADTDDRKEAYSKFGEKIKDVSQFLVDILKLSPSTYKTSDEIKGKKITWHDPCHLGRYLGISNQPRQIIKSIPDVDFVEMPNANLCCGMAGSFGLYYYELSKNIADKKVDSIKAAGADIVVSSCPGCIIQLIDSSIRNKLPVKVMHIMDLLEQ